MTGDDQMASDGNGAVSGLDQKLQTEIFNLIQYIQRLRKEIAGIALEKNDQSTFDSMADRLDAIVDSTADATNTILGAMEEIDAYVERLREVPEPAEIELLCDNINAKTLDSIQACSFQDLTGQRITKVVGSMKFVEERVNAMAEICGRQQVQEMTSAWELSKQMDNKVPLEGPQNPGEGISQDEIDQLFS